MSWSVPVSPSALKSAPRGSQVAQQAPARHWKYAAMSASVPRSPSPSKSALPQVLGAKTRSLYQRTS